MAENTTQTETLEVLAQAEHYNRWIFESFSPVVGPRVLEVGCGIGSFSRLLLERAEHLTALDVVPAYVETLTSRLEPPVGKTLDVRCLDLFTGDVALGQFDTIVMLNVLEHLEDDQNALRILMGHLRPGGHLVLLVPALMALYSNYDRSIHHFRRYNKPQLKALLTGQNMQVEKLMYFNLVGIVGWWINFCLLKKTRMEEGSVKAFNLLAPVFRFMESCFPPPAGLSLLSISKTLS